MAIYESIGGAPAVAAAVENFYVRVLGDPALAGYFENIEMKRLKAHQRSFITVALGGPEKYAGRGMAAAHAGLDITPAQFDKVVAHLADTLAELGVPADTIKTIGESLAPLQAEIAPQR